MNLEMRGAVAGSTAVHLAVMLVLFLWRGAAPMIVPGPDVVQVSLMDATAAPSIVPPAPVQEVQPEPAPQVVHEEEEGVKLEPPKPVKKPEPREERREPPRALAATTIASAAVGPAGLSAQVGVDAADFEFTYYLVLIRERIAQNWTPPWGLSGGKPIRSVVHFRIRRDGSVSAARLETGSGYEFFDQTAVRAVTISDPLPPLPLGFSAGDLGVHFGFEYVAP